MVKIEKNYDVESKLLKLSTQASRTAKENTLLLECFRLTGSERAQKLARDNKIEALVGAALQQLVTPEALGESWSAVISENEKRVKRLLEVVSAETKKLESMGIAHAAVESAGVLLGSNLSLSSLGSGDIDILVSKEGFGKAVEVFEAAGFHWNNRRDRPTARVEMKKVDSDGVVLWINVFSSPFDRMWVPLLWSDQSDAWLSRRVESHRWPGINVLKTEDSLAFVSMHTSLHSYVRSPGLRLHVDIDRLVCDNDIDWEHYIAQVWSMLIPKRAFFSISLAKQFLNTPIPDRVLNSLAPSDFVRRSVQWLVDRNGVIVDGRPKLSKIETPLLDMLLYEGGFFKWLSNMAIPPDNWMREHFSTDSSKNKKLYMLHFRRYRMLLFSWSPR